MEIEPGDICLTNLSQPGGAVNVLAIEPHWLDDNRMVAYIEHIEDHSYGYPRGDRGYYLVSDLLKLGSGEIIMWNIIKKYLHEFEVMHNIKLSDKSWQHFKAMEIDLVKYEAVPALAEMSRQERIEELENTVVDFIVAASHAQHEWARVRVYAGPAAVSLYESVSDKLRERMEIEREKVKNFSSIADFARVSDLLANMKPAKLEIEESQKKGSED